MKKSKFSDQQIALGLQQVETGRQLSMRAASSGFQK